VVLFFESADARSDTLPAIIKDVKSLQSIRGGSQPNQSAPTKKRKRAPPTPDFLSRGKKILEEAVFNVLCLLTTRHLLFDGASEYLRACMLVKSVGM
jgi:hypothetical protein